MLGQPSIHHWVPEFHHLLRDGKTVANKLYLGFRNILGALCPVPVSAFQAYTLAFWVHHTWAVPRPPIIKDFSTLGCNCFLAAWHTVSLRLRYCFNQCVCELEVEAAEQLRMVGLWNQREQWQNSTLVTERLCMTENTHRKKHLNMLWPWWLMVVIAILRNPRATGLPEVGGQPGLLFESTVSQGYKTNRIKHN